MPDKQKRFTLDDYTEELITWVWGWIKGNRIPFSKRKRVGDLAEERQKQEDSYEREHQKFEGGFYLYRATLPHVSRYVSTSRVLPYPQQSKKSKVKEKIDLASVSNYITDVSPRITQDALDATHQSAHVIATSMGSQHAPAGMTFQMSQLRQAHNKHVVGPRLGKVYSASNISQIKYQDLRFKGQHGDAVAQEQAKGKMPADTANIWVVTTQSPERIKKRGYVNPERSFIFFSAEDARLFLNNTTRYFSRPQIEKFSNQGLKRFTNTDIHDHHFIEQAKKLFELFEMDLNTLKLDIDKKIKELTNRAHKDKNKEILDKYILNGFRYQKMLILKIQAQVASLVAILSSDVPDIKALNSALFHIEKNIKYYMAKYIANDVPLIKAEEVFMRQLDEFMQLHNQAEKDHALVSQLTNVLSKAKVKSKTSRDEKQRIKRPQQKID